MLTQATPAIVTALQKVLPPAALKQLTQALGNCGQPLSHRGQISIQPSLPRQAGGRGVYGGAGADGNAAKTWNTQSYADLLPYNERAFYEIPGIGGPGGTTNNNYYGDSFSFPTFNNYNITNNYSNTIGGGTYIPGIITDRPPTIIPRDGVDGRDGRDGVDGADGAAGADGVAGEEGRAGRDGRDGRDGGPGRAGRNGRDGADGQDGISIQGPQGPAGPEGPQGPAGPQGPEGQQGIQGIQGPPGDGCSATESITYLSGQPTLTKTSSAITYATEGISGVSLGTVQVDEDKTSITYMTGATFNAETCEITPTFATIEVVTNAYLSGNLSTTPALTDTKTVLTTATLNNGATSTKTICKP